MLQGMLSPLYIEDALDYFLNNAHMNLYDEDIYINLMDFFSMQKQRYSS
jgi:hypothetical protein